MIDIYYIGILIILIFICIVIYNICFCKNEYNSNNISKFVNNLKQERIKVKDYEIVKYFGVLTDDECNKIINNSKNDLKESIVYTNDYTKTLIDKNIRISKTAWIEKENINNDYQYVIEKLENITSFITNKPVVNQENIQIFYLLIASNI